jgi:hypothetical protein
MKVIMLLLTAVGMIVIPLLIYFLNTQRPDIQYTLSEPLKLGQGESGKLWQQLEVRNEGSVRAEDIFIKVGTKISNFEISKHSEGDKAEVLSESDPFEVRYDGLVPKGKFTITLCSVQKRVTLEDISIAHSKGVGIEAFSRSQKLLKIFFFLIFFIVVAYNIIAGSRALSLGNIELSSINYLPERILKKKKPFYVPKDTWNKVREMAIERLLTRSDVYNFPSQSKSYKILCEDKPDYLENAEWDKLQEVSVSRLEENISYHINVSYDHKEILALIKIKRPQHLPDNIWIRLRKDAQDRYIRNRQRYFFSMSIKDVGSILKEDRPEGFENEIWQEFVKNASETLLGKIQDKICSSSEPMVILNDEDLSLIENYQVNILRHDAYKRQIMLMPDVRDPNGAKEFLEKGRPSWIADDDYRRYKATAEKNLKLDDCLDECSKKEKTLSEKEAELDTKNRELSNKLAKITKQLEVIDACLSDPDVLDKIEDYNNCFAPGNFANLKKISEVLKKAKDSSHK